MRKSYQKLQDVSDEQIKKAFDLRKRGLQVDRISDVTGLTTHSLHVWFTKPPEKLISRILESELLSELVVDHSNLKKTSGDGWFEPDEISNKERVSTPVIDRRGTGTGWASSYQLNLETKKAREINAISPVSSFVDATLVKNNTDRKLELTSQQIQTPSTTTTTTGGHILTLEIDSKNMVDLNSKLIDYKKVIEEHLDAVNSLLSNLDTLTYIESLEDAETDYRKRIENLEEEVARLRTVERRL